MLRICSENTELKEYVQDESKNFFTKTLIYKKKMN